MSTRLHQRAVSPCQYRLRELAVSIAEARTLVRALLSVSCEWVIHHSPFTTHNFPDVCSVPRVAEQAEQNGTKIGVFRGSGHNFCHYCQRSGGKTYVYTVSTSISRVSRGAFDSFSNHLVQALFRRKMNSEEAACRRQIPLSLLTELQELFCDLFPRVGAETALPWATFMGPLRGQNLLGSGGAERL